MYEYDSCDCDFIDIVGIKVMFFMEELNINGEESFEKCFEIVK